jgi:hypothetical protein
MGRKQDAVSLAGVLARDSRRSAETCERAGLRVVSGMMGRIDPDGYSEMLHTFLTVALLIVVLLAILGLLVVACVQALRTWAREFWPH